MVGSSSKSTSSGKTRNASRQKVARKKPVASNQNLPRVLRIGIIQGGKIIEERIVRRRETVTIGPSEKNTFVLPALDVPTSRFDIFETKGGDYTLNFTQEMSGKVSVKGEVLELSKLRSDPKAKGKGKLYHLILSDQARGKIVVGESTILFQFVAPPPIQPRPQLPAAVRGSLLASIGSFVTVCWLVFLLAESGVILWWETTDWPKASAWDKYLALEELVSADEATFEKAKKEKLEGEGDAEDEEEDAEEEEEVKQPVKKKVAASAKDEGPKKSSAEIAKERAEKRAALAAQLAERGINKILGTLGGEGGGAIADVLSGGDVGADQDELLSQVSGIGVATGDLGGSLKGPAGGKGSGEAADISQVKVKGSDKTVKTAGPGKERRIKGRVRKKKPMASGGTGMMSSSDVAKVVNRKIGAIKSCYEQALKRDPSLKGKVTIRFTISGSGKVTTARTTLNELTPAVGNCMTKSFKRFRFPPPEGGTVTFEYPFLFTPSG